MLPEDSAVVIHLSWSGILLSTSPVFVLKAVLVTNPLTSGVLFSTSSLFELKAVLVTKLLVSGIVLSIFSIFFLSKTCLFPSYFDF